MVEVLFNEDCEDILIPESASSQSSDSERPKSPKIIVISYVSDEGIHETSPSYFLRLPPFTVNIGLNTEVQNTDVVLYVYIRVGHKAGPCTANFNDLLCFPFQLALY
jgi:hypothetical protein